MLILNNGNLKRYGIGVSTFKGPYDQVIKFPAKVNKVSMNEQTTCNMQNISFTATIVWSIMRDNDGPYKAYKNLGQDICLETPEESNRALCMKARDKFKQNLANMQISEVLNQRDILRSRVRKEIQEEVRGWGVWIETVELEEVMILDNQLFKNMQAHFREVTEQHANLLLKQF